LIFASRMVARLRILWKLAYIKLNSQTPSAFAKATARQVPASWRCPGQPGILWEVLSLSIPASLSVMAATTQAMSQEFGTTSKHSRISFVCSVRRGQRRSHRNDRADTCPKSSPSPAFAGFADGQGRPSRHSPPMLRFPFWLPSEMGTFRSRGASPESSLPPFSTSRAMV
jgi:hypothetical protein